MTQSWRFRFDRTLGLKVPPPPGNGLSVSFSRGTSPGYSTIDPTGVNVNGTTPRYDRGFRMPTIPAPADVKTVSSTDISQLWAAGLDADNNSELMIFADLHSYPDTPSGYYSNLLVFVDDTLSNANVTKLVRVPLSTAVVNAADAVPPTFQPTGIPVNNRLQPVTGAVFHGAVIVAGPMLAPNAD